SRRGVDGGSGRGPLVGRVGRRRPGSARDGGSLRRGHRGPGGARCDAVARAEPGPAVHARRGGAPRAVAPVAPVAPPPPDAAAAGSSSPSAAPRASGAGPGPGPTDPDRDAGLVGT